MDVNFSHKRVSFPLIENRNSFLSLDLAKLIINKKKDFYVNHRNVKVSLC